MVSRDGSQITFYFYQSRILGIGTSHPIEKTFVTPSPNACNHQRTDASLAQVENPENYRVEILRLQEDVFTKDGETWYTYAAYAKMKQIGYKQMDYRAGRGVLARKYFFGRPYVHYVHDKDIVETIVEDGQVWYTYFAYAKLKGVTYSTLGSEVARGILEKKIINGRPYVRKTKYPTQLRTTEYLGIDIVLSRS